MAGVKRVAEISGMTPITCPFCGRKLEMINVLLKFFRILALAAKQERIRVKGFGVFYVKQFASRPINLPGVKAQRTKPNLYLRFKMSPDLKKLLNKKRG